MYRKAVKESNSRLLKIVICLCFLVITGTFFKCSLAPFGILGSTKSGMRPGTW